jgi:hypothetical protein
VRPGLPLEGRADFLSRVAAGSFLHTLCYQSLEHKTCAAKQYFV